MRLQAVLPHADLDTLLKQLLPFRVLLGKSGDDDRRLELRDPRELTFIPGEGLILSCTAELRWSVLGLTVPILLRELSVMLAPQIAARQAGPSLVFGLSITHADLAGVPAVLHGRLVDLVNLALSERQVELAWDFGKTLTHSFALPAMLASVRSFNLGVGESSVEVLADALELSIELLASVTRS